MTLRPVTLLGRSRTREWDQVLPLLTEKFYAIYKAMELFVFEHKGTKHFHCSIGLFNGINIHLNCFLGGNNQYLERVRVYPHRAKAKTMSLSLGLNTLVEIHIVLPIEIAFAPIGPQAIKLIKRRHFRGKFSLSLSLGVGRP